MPLNRILHTTILLATFEIAEETMTNPRTLLQRLSEQLPTAWSQPDGSPAIGPLSFSRSRIPYRGTEWEWIPYAEGSLGLRLLVLWERKMMSAFSLLQVLFPIIPWIDIQKFILFYYEQSNLTEFSRSPSVETTAEIVQHDIEILRKYFLNQDLHRDIDFWIDQYNEEVAQIEEEIGPVLPNQKLTPGEKFDAVKEDLKDILELVDESVKDKIPEGVYLELMNKMKSAYNHM